MHDHNLDDLIIDNIEPKNSKTKSFLTIIALLIVILIVAIILTKVLLNTPNEDKLAFEEDATEMIAPELKLKEAPKQPKEKEEPSLPKVIEESAVVTKKEKIAPEIQLPEVPKAEEIKKEPVLSNILDQEIKAPAPEIKKPVRPQKPLLSTKEQEAKDAADIAYWEAVQKKRRAEKIAREAKAKKVVKKAIEVKEPVKPKKVKTAIETPVKKRVKKPVAAKPIPKSVSTKKYYVQVGSFRTKPSSRFISVIKNNGFKYTIKRSADGTKKLLIGPYGDRASVNRSLIQVRDRINKSAFVVKR